MEFYIDQIFENEYPQEVVEFCKTNKLDNPRLKWKIAEMEPLEKESIDKDGNVVKEYIPRFMLIQTSIYDDFDDEKRVEELQKYLDETDWYAARYAETGVAIPDDIKTARQAARDEISAIKAKYSL
jgi:hypothetical protein